MTLSVGGAECRCVGIEPSEPSASASKPTLSVTTDDSRTLDVVSGESGGRRALAARIVEPAPSRLRAFAHVLHDGEETLSLERQCEVG